MQEFTGIEMLNIDIANCFGLDKEDWTTRLLWAESREHEFEELIDQAAEPLLYRKAVLAHKDVTHGFGTGHNMFMDATASGLQIMAALSGCKKTARHVNMIKTSSREDVYNEVRSLMNKQLPIELFVTRDGIKKPVMTHYYNKSKQDTLEMEQKVSFYNVLSESFEGAEMVKDVINSYWNPTAFEHTWPLPDGHIAKVLVTDIATARIEVDELDHTTFAYRFESNQPSNVATSLCPNIIHSIDGYIVRELIRRAKAEGFELAHIFDAFTCHPNYMSRVMRMYREVMADIADSTLLQDILSAIAGRTVYIQKYSNDLSQDILNSEYMLS